MGYEFRFCLIHTEIIVIYDWERLLTDNSLCMIKYLLDYEKEFFAKINQSLTKEIDEIKVFEGHSEFAELENKLQRNVKTLKRTIKDCKHRKYIRDVNDFQTNTIY